DSLIKGVENGSKKKKKSKWTYLLQYFTVLHSTPVKSTILHSTILYSTPHSQYSTVQYSTGLHNTQAMEESTLFKFTLKLYKQLALSPPAADCPVAIVTTILRTSHKSLFDFREIVLLRFEKFWL
uniref:Uncharacterized protein n=1 Tax=Periophthalmus magnuspinnatus TaxID=409849 RepID=A0A3B4BNB3_9GOBI